MRNKIAEVLQDTAVRVRGLRGLRLGITISDNQRSENMRLREDAIVAVFFGGDMEDYECSAEKGFVDCDCFFERWRTYGVTVGHNGVIHFDAGPVTPAVLAAAARLDSAGACDEDGMDGDY